MKCQRVLRAAKYPRALPASGDSRLTWREFYLLLKPHRGRQTLLSGKTILRVYQRALPAAKYQRALPAATVLLRKTVLWALRSGAPLCSCIVRARRAKSFAGSARTRHLFEKGGRKLHFLTTAAIAGMKLYFLTMLSLAKCLRALPASGDSRLTWREFYLLLKPHRGRQTLFSHHAVTREAPVGASPPRSACACYAP